MERGRTQIERYGIIKNIRGKKGIKI